MCEDLANFRAIFPRNALRSIEKDYYKWKIINNPYQRGFIYLEQKGSKVAGSATITPKKITVLGKKFLGAEIGDTFTHPDCRRQGVFSRGVTKCTEQAISNGINIIYGTPNPLSLAGYQKKLGYPPCPFVKVKHMSKYTHVLPIEKVLSRKLSQRLGRPYLSKLISRIYFQYLYYRSRGWHQSRAPRQEKTFDVVPVEQFRTELDGLWGMSRADYVFFTIRNEIYLNWRFLTNPDNYAVLAAIEGDTYLGYVVTKLSSSMEGEYLIGTICDFITHHDRQDVFCQLIREAEKRLNEAGAHCLQVWCAENSPYYQSLVLSGYISECIVRVPVVPVIVYAGTEVGRQILETNGKWHFTMADSDNI